MSSRKRRGDQLAPALFPFMAVLLCTIGALVLILAITVTNSHASARAEAEMEFLVVQDQQNLAIAWSEELMVQREEIKNQIEKRRAELQHIEDHIARLNSELDSLQSKQSSLEESNAAPHPDREAQLAQIEELKAEIEAKKEEIAAHREKLENKRPAFAIVPYTGKNGTHRRPIYIECTSKGLILQPEGVVISTRDLFPPVPSNPLAASMRLLRNKYEKADTLYGSSPPPYPLLLVRPDGVEAFHHARRALSSWEDQYGYELIDAEMELAFPLGVPGTKVELERVVTESKIRLQELIQANPRLARQYAIEKEGWDEIESLASSSSTPSSRGSGASSSSVGAGTAELSEGSGNWKMVRPASPYASSGAPPRSGVGNGEGISSPTPPSSSPSSPSTSSSSSSSTPHMEAGDIDPNLGMMVAQSQENLSGGSGVGGSGGLSGDSVSHLSVGDISNGAGDAGNFQGGGGGSSGSSSGASATGANQTGTAAISSPIGGSSPFASQSGSPSSMSSAQFANQAQSASQPGSQQSMESDGEVGMVTFSPISQDSSPSSDDNQPMNTHVIGSRDAKPIATSEGKNWAQKRGDGKATPVSRAMVMVAINDKWYLRSEVGGRRFDATIDLNQGADEVSEQLAQAIRDRVDSWGLSVRGGYWVPTVVIESASDAQRSVARLERLLEGSGVEIKVVALQLR